jgi:hypothetical protein
MSEHLDDSQRTLEQRALRNVRGLLDKLETEDRDRDAANRRAIAAVAAVGVAIVAILATCAYRPEPSAVIIPSQTSVARAGGVFQILRMGTRIGEFAFSGWEPGGREVIEVDAGLGGDLKHAIVKRMIQLIRTHYAGEFKWASRRLGRDVILSARPEDNDGLEDFLIKEFFGTPPLAVP